MAPIDARQKIEQIRRSKRSQPVNVRDLRQLIVRKKKQKKYDLSPGRDSRISKNSAPRDLRETNKKLASRRIVTQTRNERFQNNKNDTFSRAIRSANGNDRNLVMVEDPIKSTKYTRPTQVLYVPPQLQNQQAYIIAPTPPKSNLAMDNEPDSQAASILISNLMPTITQSEIIELFGDIGVMTAVNMINQTTALVTYQNSSDAVRAVKVYHNRLLDGEPLLVNMMPNSTTTTSRRWVK